MAEIEHPHLAVMFTDIKGYSRMMSEDEVGALAVLEEHNQIMESVIDAHGGRIIKKLGDSYMVILEQADEAVKCGLHALSKIAARNRRSATPVEIRVGVHEGSMLERDGDFFGENVNLAARLEQLAKPMTIAVSESVLQQVATRVKCEARFLGAHSLKNIRYPVSVYQLTAADSWKLYLSIDGQAADEGHDDLLDDLADADAARRRVADLTQAGSLDAAARLADAALSKLGGFYHDYVLLAAVHLLAGDSGEAMSVLKIGDMLGQKGPQDDDLAWVLTLAQKPLPKKASGFRLQASGKDSRPDSRGLAPVPPATQEFERCIAGAQKYLAANPGELVLTLLFERFRARLEGDLEGLKNLAQAHPDTALILRGYAEALKDQGHQSDADAMLERAISVAPEVADHRLRRVQWMVEGGDLESVLAESDKLAKMFPDHAGVYQWTGKTRLLNLDPHGAQWIFEQRKDSAVAGNIDSARWHICSLMQQGRFEAGVEQAHTQMRSAIRQNRRQVARKYLRLAVAGVYLDHSEGVTEMLEEYRRFDPDWRYAQAVLLAVRCGQKLLPWNRALEQLHGLAQGAETLPYPHPSGLAAISLLHVVPDAQHYGELHELEFLKSNRDWIISRRDLEAAGLEARAALRFDRIDAWHLQLVPVLTHLGARHDHRLPSLLALAGLIQTKLNDFEDGKAHLQQADKLWGAADWPVWEIEQARSALAAGSTASSSPNLSQ